MCLQGVVFLLSLVRSFFNNQHKFLLWNPLASTQPTVNQRQLALGGESFIVSVFTRGMSAPDVSRAPCFVALHSFSH